MLCEGTNCEISVNKSDFNPRKYLTLWYGPDFFPLPNKYCEKYTTETAEGVKTSSLVNNEAEIAKYQNCTALIAYSLQVVSGYSSFRTVYRIYTLDDNAAKTIREKILLTQQYILCSLIHFPKTICNEDKLYDEAIFEKYRSRFEHMYENVCLEVKERGLEPNIKDKYLPSIRKSSKDVFSKTNIQGSTIVHEKNKVQSTLIDQPQNAWRHQLQEMVRRQVEEKAKAEEKRKRDAEAAEEFRRQMERINAESAKAAERRGCFSIALDDFWGWVICIVIIIVLAKSGCV